MTQNQHIIIVDDEAPAREMVGDYLKMMFVQHSVVPTILVSSFFNASKGKRPGAGAYMDK